MDYLDEFDNSAIQALTELGGEVNLATPTFKHPDAADTSTRSAPYRRRRLQPTYLLRLEHPLATPLEVANILGLSRVPQLETGSGEDGEACFCRLPQTSVSLLDSWAAKHHPGKWFTKIRLNVAHKDSMQLPLLGRDCTLPHYRPNLPTSPVHAIPNREFPVYYFFYGTLADPDRLSRLLGIPKSSIPPLESALILDGQVGTWADKYRALVDAPGRVVQGFLYLATSVDQEELLRAYEGDSYEVVRARAVLEGKEIEARTFRFARI